jgi:hypothetical protein
MAFNLGAFAGGLAKGGMDTYVTLKDIERRDQEAAQRAEVHDAWKKEQAGKEGLRQAIGEIPSGDTVQVPTYEGMTGGLDQQDIPTRAETISPDQKMANFRQRAIALGADPTAVQQYEAGGLQIQSAKQGLKKGDMELGRLKAEDDFSQWFQNAQKKAAADPVAFVREHLGDYNKPKPGSHMDDKLTGDVVPGADGKSFSFVQKDAKGKVVASTPITPETAMQGLQSIAFTRWTSLPGKFKEGVELGQKDRALGTEDRKVGVMEDELKAKKPLFAAQANQANAGANQANAHAGVYRNMLETAKTNKEAGAAMQPFLDKIAGLADPTGVDKPEADKLMLQAAAAGATKSKDIATLYTQLQKPNRSVLSAEHEKAAYSALNKALESGDKKLIEAARAAYPDVFGEDPMVAAFKKAQGNGGKAPAAGAAAPAAAIPATAPAAPAQQSALPLSQRLATAISTDNSNGNRNNFGSLADEVSKALPVVQTQIKTLESALPNARSASEQANLRGKIEQLKADLPQMQAIITQRRAQLGY